MDVKVRKADSLLWACRRPCGASWGLRPKVVHWLNISIIQPSITLASFISAKKRLNRYKDLPAWG